jgi:hypothetical protein
VIAFAISRMEANREVMQSIFCPDTPSEIFDCYVVWIYIRQGERLINPESRGRLIAKLVDDNVASMSRLR